MIKLNSEMLIEIELTILQGFISVLEKFLEEYS